jgi:hypothetical protein
MTTAIDANVEMNKSDLFEVIRKHHEFIGAKVVVFLYGETRYLTNSDGHWLVFAVDFSCDTVFVYDSCNRFKGVSEAFKKLKKAFIKPQLCYLVQNSKPLDRPEKGKVQDVPEINERVASFKLETSVRAPRTQKDFFSCGLWATEVLFQMVMEKKNLNEIEVDITDLLQQRRAFLVRLMSTRYLYIDGVFRDPLAKEEEEKSDVSRITSKTAGGKALGRHCPLCDFKLILGANWARHCKTFHKDTEV